MSSGGTSASKSIFFIMLVPLAAIAAIILAINFEWISNIIVYGKMSGPCIWPGDYVDHMGGSMDDLVYNEDRECYQKP